jgi:hypothetical protein
MLARFDARHEILPPAGECILRPNRTPGKFNQIV